MNTTIDTLTLFETFKKAFTEEQAQTLSRTLAATWDEQAASKRDIKELDANLRREIEAVRLEMKQLDVNLRREIEAVRTELKHDIKNSEITLRREIEAVRSDLKQDIKALEVKIAETRTDIIRWVIGISFAQLGFLVAILKLLP